MSGVDAPRDDGPGDGAPISDLAAAYVVYTDGSCKPNPGPGGWAYVFMYGDETWHESGEEGIEEDTVSPRMEVLAVVRALAATPPGSAVVVRTDSAYVHDSITTHIKTWLDNGWKLSGGRKPVKHQDLWRTLWALSRRSAPSPGTGCPPTPRSVAAATRSITVSTSWPTLPWSAPSCNGVPSPTRSAPSPPPSSQSGCRGSTGSRAHGGRLAGDLGYRWWSIYIPVSASFELLRFAGLRCITRAPSFSPVNRQPDA